MGDLGHLSRKASNSNVISFLAKRPMIVNGGHLNCHCQEPEIVS